MILWQMPPCASRDDVGDCTVRDVILISEVYLTRARCIDGADADNIAFCKLGASMMFATATMAASLRYFIPHVVLTRSEEQVCRVHARRVVATMEHAQSIGNPTICQPPRETMGSCGLTAARNVEHAVAKLRFRSYPKPALAAPVDFAPEPYDHLLIHGNSLLWVTPPDVARYRGGTSIPSTETRVSQ